MDTWHQWFPPDTFKPMGQYLGEGWTEEQIKVCSVQVATELVGIGPGSQLYRDACWPGDVQYHQLLMEKAQSACALVAACVLRCLGCRHPLLMPPYYGRNDAMSRLEQVARDLDAWDGADSLPNAGDIAIIGTDCAKDHPRYSEIIKTWGTPGHAFICSNRIVDRSKGQNVFHSVDGGRGVIQEKERRLKCFGNENWLAGWTTRRIYGVIRVGKIKIPHDVQWCMPDRLSLGSAS